MRDGSARKRDIGRAKGVGGWLAVALLVFAAWFPIRSVVWQIANLYRDHGEATAAVLAEHWVILKLLEWSIGGVAIGAWLYIAWQLYWRREWRSIRLAIAGVWLIHPIWRATEHYVVYALGLSDPELAIRHAVETTVGSMLWAALWTIVLLCSRRVANTYARGSAGV